MFTYHPLFELFFHRSYLKTTTAFKFAVNCKSVKSVRTYIETDIIKNDLPMQLNHKSMITAGKLLNFKNGSCWILGRYIELQRTTSGYYSLLLTNMLLRAGKLLKIVSYCEALEKVSSKEKRRKVEKLHRQFAHSSKERLISLVRGSRIFYNKEVLDVTKGICYSSSVCLKFKRPSLWPVVDSMTLFGFKGIWT